MAKVIQQEAKVEKKALESAVKELADLQKMQKYAVKEEAKTNASYGTALRKFRQEEIAFLAAQARFERAKADLQVPSSRTTSWQVTLMYELQAYEDAREAAREHARQATEMLQEKNREVEWLRAQKAADDVSTLALINCSCGTDKTSHSANARPRSACSRAKPKFSHHPSHLSFEIACCIIARSLSALFFFMLLSVRSLGILWSFPSAYPFSTVVL